MKDLDWDYVMSVGVDEIDDDHKRLVALFNILNHSVNTEEDPAYLAAVLEELINCTVWHFSHEERLMLKYQYDEYAEHKTEHRELIESVEKLKGKILQAGTSISEDDLLFLERWLTEHILTFDNRLGAHLSEAM